MPVCVVADVVVVIDVVVILLFLPRKKIEISGGTSKDPLERLDRVNTIHDSCSRSSPVELHERQTEDFTTRRRPTQLQL